MIADQLATMRQGERTDKNPSPDSKSVGAPVASLKHSSAIISIWPNGRNFARQSKSSLERNMSDSLFHPSAGIWPLKSRTSGPFDDLTAFMLTFGWIEEMLPY
jgi:hypothetical protein